MTDKSTRSRTWGIALILSAVIVSLVGYVGSGLAKDMHQRVLSERAEEEWIQRQAIASDHWSALEKSLGEVGPFELRIKREAAIGPEIEMPEKLAQLATETARNAEEDLRSAFPDQLHAVQVRFRTGGDPANVGTTQVNMWTKADPSLPEEAGTDPRQFRLWGGSVSDEPIEVHFLVPRYISEQEEGETISPYTVERYYTGNILKQLDVAGNEVMVGIRGYLSMRFLSNESVGIVTAFSVLSTVLLRLGQLGLVLLLVTPPVWVYLDARTRRLPAVLWLLFAIPTSVLGALVYSIANREAGPACPECGEKVSTRFVVCPYCQTELKGTCPNCGQTVGLKFSYCPSCATEL
jgi:hypothetical protein